MLVRSIRASFCFRYRREWEYISGQKISNLSSFMSQLEIIEGNNLEPYEKRILLQLISTKRKQLSQLINTASQATTLTNTVCNWYIFQLQTSNIEAQMTQKTLSLSKICQHSQTLAPYLGEYLKLAQEFLSNKLFIDRIRRRFGVLEEAFMRDVILNYEEVKGSNSQDLSNVKYREDKQFQLRELSLDDLKQIGRMLYTYTHFGLISKKMGILCQLILKKHHQQMDSCVYEYLFSLAHTKMGLRVIEEDLILRMLKNRINNHRHSMFALYYLILNQVTHQQVIDTLIKDANKQELDINSLNINEIKLVRYLKLWLESPHNNYSQLEIDNNTWSQISDRIVQFNQDVSSSEMSFRGFIQRHQFKYKQTTDRFFLKPSYEMSSNMFLFFDFRDLIQFKEETGLVHLGKDHYKIEAVRIKSISDTNITKTETRREEYDYYWNKLRKEEKGAEIDKPLYYEF